MSSDLNVNVLGVVLLQRSNCLTFSYTRYVMENLNEIFQNVFYRVLLLKLCKRYSSTLEFKYKSEF